MSDYDFLWDGSLSNDEIIEAASSGATRDEWQYIDENEYMMESTDKPYSDTFLFIDAENIGSSKFTKIYKELKKIGLNSTVRVYSLQKDSRLKNWHKTARKYSLEDIRLYGKRVKNMCDNKIIKDILKKLGSCKQVKNICIASSDSDFCSILKEVGAKGIKTFVFGEKNTSKKLRSSCNRFIEV